MLLTWGQVKTDAALFPSHRAGSSREDERLTGLCHGRRSLEQAIKRLAKAIEQCRLNANPSDTIAPIELSEGRLHFVDRNWLCTRQLTDRRLRIEGVKVRGPGREDRSFVIKGKSRCSHHVDRPLKLQA
jgi:hypothetical protein